MFNQVLNLLALPINAIACKRNLKRSGLEPVFHIYARRDALELGLDLYLPEKGTHPFPAILFLHGGGWSAGDRTAIEPVALAQVSRGYALAAIDYRLSHTAIWPAQLHDVRAAMRWLRSNAQTYDLDPQRLFVFGVSAGGHLACMLGTTGDRGLEEDGAQSAVLARPDGVVAFYPPTDFLKAEPVGPRAFQAHAPKSPQAQLIGAPIHEAADRTASANPIAWIDGTEPPFLLLHGEADCLVDPGQSALLAAALAAKGGRVALHRAPGLRHADLRFNASPYKEIVERFLDDPFSATA